MMNESDSIIIRGLRVTSCVGVPDEERASAQELLLHVTMAPCEDGMWLNDDITRTIDYHAVVVRIGEVSGEKPRKLIETLAEDVAAMVLREFAVRRVTVEVEKFILPETQSVGVRITRPV